MSTRVTLASFLQRRPHPRSEEDETMLQRILVTTACFMAAFAVGSIAKVQKTLLSAPGRQIQERLADRQQNCGLSCTAIAPDASKPQTV
jgi:hypothetical protein